MQINISKGHHKYPTIDLSSEVEGVGDGFLSFLIGRSPECHVHLDDKMISREHVKLTYEKKGWSLDQVSASSCFKVNGEPKNKYQLQSGDIVTVGPYTIEYIFIQNNEVVVEKNPSGDDGEGGGDAGLTVFMPNEPQDGILLDDIYSDNENDKDNDNNNDIDNDIDNDDLEVNDSFDLTDDTSDDEGSSLDEGDNLGDSSADILQEDSFENDEFSEGGDEGYTEEESYGLEEFDDEKTQVFSGFSSFELEIFGEFAPYDKYVIENDEVFIGRDPEKCQIVLNDPEVSSVHAVIKRSKVVCTLEDLKSGNGTLLEGKRINKIDLENNDEFVIGSTTFTIRIGSSFLKQEEGRLMPVEENQFVEVEEIVEVGTDFDTQDEAPTNSNASLFSKEALQDPEKRKKILIILVVLIGVWVLLDEEEAPGKAKNVKLKKAKIVTKTDKLKKQFTPEELEFLSSTYELAKELNNSGRYAEAMSEMEKILPMDKNYKNLLQLYELSKLGLKKLEEQEKLRQAEIERKIRIKKIAELVKKAKEATKERNVDVAETLFQQILSLDPENIDITLLKRELESWKKEKERKALEKAQKEAERKRQVRLLAPGKNFYLKEEWHKAIGKLQVFLNKKDMDEDLVANATKMFNESKQNLEKRVNPLLGKARSLREGQDLKGAYEVYKEILVFHPNHREALIEMDDIRSRLHVRSKKAYREAIISESLSLFDDAKEKFQEVQQISPSDSEYYKKATEQLKEYVE